MRYTEPLILVLILQSYSFRYFLLIPSFARIAKMMLLNSCICDFIISSFMYARCVIVIE
jgi:hypothetical protein